LKVCLTIDVEQDCPPYLNTYRGIEEGLPLLLSLLKEEKIPATFFVTGDVAKKHPNRIQQIVKEGHELGCHGDTHRRFDQMNIQEAEWEISESTRILRSFSPVISFRAPNLQFPPQYLPLLEKEGYLLDSSEGKYKFYGLRRKPVTSSLTRIPASTTSSVLRFPTWIRHTIFNCLKSPVVLFVHPWEFVDFTKSDLRWDCRFKTGKKALLCLQEVIQFFKNQKNAEFCQIISLR